METEVPLETEEILRKLGDNFGLDDGVVEALLRLGVENLQEFRFLWASEQAIETWIGKLGLGDECLADDSSGAQSMGSRRAVLPPGRTRSLQDCTVRSGHDARGDRASRHQATVLEALQDEVSPRDPPSRYYDLEGGQGDAEADALRLQHLEGENAAVPAHHFSEETQAQ